MLASEVMNASAALLNDIPRSVFTYPVQIPYLNMALAELRELFQQNNIPATNSTRMDITIPAGTTELIFNAVSPAPSLPADLIEPLELYERTSGVDEDYVPMQRMRFLPSYVTQTNWLIYWVWEDQKIKFIGSNADEELRIDYVRSILPAVVDKDDPINLINSLSFLQYRTAALCSQFIGENEDRASVLNQTAQLALDRVLSIGIKGGQSIATRRRPFNQSYKLWNSSL